MRLAFGVAVLTFLATGCASSGSLTTRDEVIRKILPSTVQLRCEREGGGRRSASGVVVASDAVTRRSWIVTARHFLEPPTTQQIHLTAPGRKDRTKLVVVASSPDADVTLLVAEGIVLPAVNLKEIAKLGDDVWVLAFPWGRRLTVVGGVVSQISADAGDDAFEGPARMIDASVSYGASGGGVFDARTGELIGIIESYRTARVGTTPPQVFEVPVPGETTLVSSAAIVRLMKSSDVPAEAPK